MSRPCPDASRTRLARAAALLLAVGALAGCPPAASTPCDALGCEAQGLRCVDDGAEAVCRPPLDPCGADNPCKADEACVVTTRGTAQCLAPDRCLTVTCGNSKGCDPATGECTVNRPPCGGSCAPGFVCDPDKNACRPANDRCNGICCPSTHVCNPATGACVPDQCQDADIVCQCRPDQTCESVEGKCLDTPGPCGGACGAEEACDVVSGTCVSAPSGIATGGAIGASCTTTGECGRSGTDGFCIEDGGIFGNMPGGMCSAVCSVTGCPSGSLCLDLGIQICLDVCRESTDCRTGYACTQMLADNPAKFCFPTSPSGSACNGPSCAPVGSPCREDDECVKGATCSRGAGFPGGYCLKRDCKMTGSSADCDEEREACECFQADTCGTSFLALGSCDAVLQDCRPGYSCLSLSATKAVCYPRQCKQDVDCQGGANSCAVCDAARGLCNEPCRTDAQCSGGRRCDAATGRCFQRCRFASDNCGPDAVCDTANQKCALKCSSDAMCEEGSFCERSSGRCRQRCTSGAECRGGEFCDRLGQCRPRCASDTECLANELCEEGACQPRCSSTNGCTFGEFCDTTTGRCRAELRNVLVGAPCTDAGDCGAYNGVCLEGASYPGGYCTTAACSGAEPCGAGATCVAWAGTQRCLDACPEGAGACRGGYACRPVGGLDVCVPAEPD